MNINKLIVLQHGGNQLDNQHAFQNGAVATMSLVPPAVPPLLQQQYGLVGTQDLIQTDSMKMDMPNWDGGRMNVAEMQEKQQVGNGASLFRNDVYGVVFVPELEVELRGAEQNVA